MNVILASGRDASPIRAAIRLDADAAFAAALAGVGCDVRWIVPAPEPAAVPAVPAVPTVPAAAGVRVIHVASRMPPFRAVEARVLDRRTETELSRQIRAELPGIVHLLGYGGGMSAAASWVANRLGVEVLVSLHAAPVLCHRGDLMYAGRSECTEWNDMQRCTTCCLTPAASGLSALGSLVGRTLRAVRFPFHPFPAPRAFENRREQLFAGLLFAERIAVGSESDRDRVASCGVPRVKFELMADAAPADWLALYRRVASRSYRTAGV